MKYPMRYDEQTPRLDARKWARWLTNATGIRHSVYRVRRLFRRTRWVVQFESKLPPKRGRLEATMAVHSEN